jgi:hypothetical protein
MSRMKRFRIVECVSGTGRRCYQVQHQVRLLGLSLWWSSTWFWNNGGADYDMSASTIERARKQLEQYKQDYREKTAGWSRRVVQAEKIFKDWE